jgi:predicted DNA binding CopG/RHH family protein
MRGATRQLVVRRERGTSDVGKNGASISSHTRRRNATCLERSDLVTGGLALGRRIQLEAASTTELTTGRNRIGVNEIKIEVPKFTNNDQETDWWASKPGRDYVKQRSASAQSKRIAIKGSRLIANLNKKSSVQIAIRLPEQDLEQAREIAERKGIGYQTLLRMLVHEGLSREVRRS